MFDNEKFAKLKFDNNEYVRYQSNKATTFDPNESTKHYFRNQNRTWYYKEFNNTNINKTQYNELLRGVPQYPKKI